MCYTIYNERVGGGIPPSQPTFSGLEEELEKPPLAAEGVSPVPQVAQLPLIGAKEGLDCAACEPDRGCPVADVPGEDPSAPRQACSEEFLSRLAVCVAQKEIARARARQRRAYISAHLAEAQEAAWQEVRDGSGGI